jgi:carbonic anhydrase
MSIDVLLGRNRAFAHSGGHHDVPLVPRQQLFVITCLDPRTDPAAFLGLQGGDAMVIRNAGGRVTPRVVDDVAFISYLAETMVGADGPLFEVAIVHHTECGTGFLADEDFRRGFAQRTGLDERALAAEAVLDPTETVRGDVEQLLTSHRLSARLTVSGHVYDLATGLVDLVVAPTHPRRSAG